jgi:hypothetical protein
VSSKIDSRTILDVGGAGVMVSTFSVPNNFEKSELYQV